MLSIVIPARNEAHQIADALHALQALRARGHEVIVVDGGSDDETIRAASAAADRVLVSGRGRAQQMNAGARLARGDVLLFLHADTRLPADADVLIFAALAASARVWGRFDVRIDGAHPLLRVVEWMMNVRSRMSGICTGDQGIFVVRDVFNQAGGYAALALMEDIELSGRLRRVSPPINLPATALTSARRWERNGVIRTIMLMWWLRLRYFLGASPARLARLYEWE
jgi:rSAM/selenodomain-associated transferase 2